MKNIFKLKFIWLVIVAGACQTHALAQEINVDSLLYKTLDLLKEKEYAQVKINAKNALKIAPDYLDYNLVLGKAQEMTGEIEKARQNYELVIHRNTDYKTAFSYLFDLEFKAGNYRRAQEVIESAIKHHPDEERFYFKKLATFQPLDDLQGEYAFIKKIQPQFPTNNDLERRLIDLELRFDFDLVGTDYSISSFDRDGVGPWHLFGLQYIRQREWGSLIGRVNYADRQSAAGNNSTGLQYELNSYFYTGKKSYSYVGGSYSNDQVFPTWRFGFSYFRYFNKGWGGDIGGRYTQTFDNRQFYTASLGLNKYLGSYWIYLRSYFMTEDNDKYYPAITLTTRYYLDTRFDYVSLNLSYGNSPDERATLGQFQSRVSTESYRINLGYFRMFNERYLAGIQVGYNNQEFLPDRFQNEFEVFLSFQYKLN